MKWKGKGMSEFHVGSGLYFEDFRERLSLRHVSAEGLRV